MKIRKITALAGSLLMAGLTVTTAAAAAFPAPFVNSAGTANVAVVYGTNGGVSATGYDMASAQNVDAALKTYIKSDGAVSAGDIKLTENEVVLGDSITATGSKIVTPIKDNKLSGLEDTKISWDDGTGTSDYNVHEEIAVSGMNVLTTVDDKNLDNVALTNEQGLEYKYIFDDHLNVSAVGTDNADTLYLTIMGHEYEIESMTTNSITVTTSEENSFSQGDTYSIDGKTVTIGNIFDGSIEVSVDGKTEIIAASGTKKIDGIRINVDTIGYNSNSPETSRAVLKIGKDISKTYSNGDEYIGQNQDDPLWTWDLSTLNTDGGYIGVKYAANINSANDQIAGDTIKYVGEGYVLPDNYAAVTLDSLTDAKYQDLKFYFQDSENLYNNSDTSTAYAENKPVLVIEADNNDVITTGGQETDKIYLYYNTTAGAFQTLYHDFDGDYSPSGRMRLANSSVASVASNNVTDTTFATVAIGDTDLTLKVGVNGGVGEVIVTNDDFSNSQVLNLTMGGTTISNSAGTLEQFGTEAENAQAGDISFNSTDVSTQDYTYMDHFGVKLSDGTTVKDQADSDEATLSVPEEQVYAQVTVSMGATVSDGGALGSLMIKDTEAATSSASNLVIVGGSCINSAAAAVLGGAYCGSDFTANTGVGVNEFMIKGYANSAINGKFALVVAGYELADTTNAVTYLTNKMPDTSKEWKGTSATEATVQVA